MLTFQQPAFVLHARAWRETSLLLECLTRDQGRLGVVARGVRGTRARMHRSDLEPFQRLAMDLSQRGELATLRGVEPDGPTWRLRGNALLSGMYLNELLVRLCARQDPHPEVFDAYAATLGRLDAGETPGWTLRRFERDLLAALGYAMQLQFDAVEGRPLQADGWYRYLADQGPQACAAATRHAVRGADLLALDMDRCPDADGQRRLRSMMREVLRFHLGGTELRAWRMLAAGPAGMD
jgi:DNA repair protein RecO (recombination protein O)